MAATQKHPLVLIALAASASSWGSTPTAKPLIQEPNFIQPAPHLEATDPATLADQLEDDDLQSGRTAPPALAGVTTARPIIEIRSNRPDHLLGPRAVAGVIDQAPKQSPPPSPLA